MTQEIAASMMIALAMVLLGLAWWGWRNRRARFRHLEGSLVRTVPASPSLLSFEGLYVATTLADHPMDRVPVGPLSFRAKAQFSIHREGLVVGAQGEAPVVLGSEGGLEAGLATWTIDRVVEPDGLVMIRWSLNGTALDSYLRIVHTDTGKIIETVNSLRGKTE
jgi:hypothetical protein